MSRRVPYSGVVDMNAGWFKEKKKRKVNQLICSHTGTSDVRYLENGRKEMLVKLEDCGW